MARILCAYSGLDIQVSHFPIYLTSRECYHPIFTLSRKKLMGFASKWAAQELTPTDNYLYYLALLHSTSLVEWRVPALQTADTQKLIAENTESLLNIVGKIDLVLDKEAYNPPHFVVSPDTKDLSCTPDWIAVWKENWDDYQQNYRTANFREKIIRRESALERLIKDPTKNPESYAASLAEWANLAGQFPTHDAGLDPSILGGKSMPLCDYWKLIIRKCVKAEAIFSIPDADIDELIEHCEDSIDIVNGGIFCHALLHLLREGKKKKSSFLGLGDFDVTGPSFKILDANAGVEEANKLALIATAPTEKPVEKDYPSKIAFLRAKLRYDMAQSQITANALAEEASKNTEQQQNRRATDLDL